MPLLLKTRFCEEVIMSVKWNVILNTEDIIVATNSFPFSEQF